MDIFAFFEHLLKSSTNRPSDITIKNYVSDVRHFSRWYENTFQLPFNFEMLPAEAIDQYMVDESIAFKSRERRIFALKKFYQLIRLEGAVISSPFDQPPAAEAVYKDSWEIKGFRNYLYASQASANTVKNYLHDIEGFKKWLEGTDFASSVAPQEISGDIIEQYKSRLIHVLGLNPKSVNRKLSSLRRYLDYLKVKQIATPASELPKPTPATDFLSIDQITNTNEEEQYSQFPPFRLVQRLYSPLNDAQEVLADYIAKQIRSNDKPSSSPTPLASTSFKNVPKEFYAPLSISTKHMTRWQQIIFHAKYSRPSWYKAYHALPFTPYFHGAVLIIASISVALVLYNRYYAASDIHKQILGETATAPSRILSFNGRITDPQLNPVTTSQMVRFAIYTSDSSSSPLWTELRSVKPDSHGIFTVGLGEKSAIPHSLFSSHESLYLGVKVGSAQELKPRQRLAMTSYAANSETLQGMVPITSLNAGNSNVILALDSSGDLNIGGNANPTFQATGGTFTLSGNTVVITTNAKDGNIELNPDGDGIIDIQKSIKNTSDNGVFSGAVHIDDSLYISTGDASRSAVIINNLGNGDLFTASTSGVTKFIISNAGNVGIGTNNPGYLLDVRGTTNISGSLRLNGVSYSWPSAVGVANSFLSTDVSGNLSWTSISGSAFSPFVNSGGAIYAPNITQDFLIGGTSTDSAKFGVTGLNSSTPTAILSGNLTLKGSRLISTTDNNTLTLGDSNTGDLIFNPNGNVGIGLTDPSYKFQVNASSGTESVAQVYNTSSASTADGLNIRLGNSSATTIDTTNHFVNFSTDGVGLAGAITGNGGTGVTYSTSAVADFAEYMKKDESEDIPYGSLICIQEKGEVTVCQEGEKVIGVSSERPAFLGGPDLGDRSVAVGLMGIVSVRITSENGEIKAGDVIGTSSLPGVGAKARNAGFILGRALQSSSEATDGKIQMVISPTWYDPEAYLADSGELVTDEQLSISTVNPILSPDTQTFSVTRAGVMINRIGTLSKAIIGNLTVGMINAQEIMVAGSLTAKNIVAESLILTTDAITISGLSLKDYITKIMRESELAFRENPSVYAENMTTNFISPLSSDSQIGVDLEDSAFTIRSGNSASASAVTTIDNEGNISTQGNIQSNALYSDHASTSSFMTNTATISGVLNADTIIANNIAGLDEKVNNITSEYINRYKTEQENRTQNISTASAVTNFAVNSLPNNFIDISTISAQFAWIKDGLVAMGPSTFTTASVMDQFSIGTSFIMDTNSINTLGHDLEIQPLKQGNVSFFAGLVMIDTQGNLLVNGDANFNKNVTVKGNLAAGMISALEDQNLNLSLGKKKNGQSQSITVLDDAKRPVLDILSNGDVVSSGSAIFARDLVASGAAILAKLNLFSAPVEAVSDTEGNASGSAGTAILKAGRRHITINSTLITEDSLIYITPIGNTNNQVVYLERQVSGESFTVGVAETAAADIQFNWMIIN